MLYHKNKCSVSVYQQLENHKQNNCQNLYIEIQNDFFRGSNQPHIKKIMLMITIIFVIKTNGFEMDNLWL